MLRGKKTMKIRQIVKNVYHACLFLFVYFLTVFHNKCLAWFYLFRAYMSFCNQFGIFYKIPKLDLGFGCWYRNQVLVVLYHKLDITQRISLLVRSSWFLFIHTANILVLPLPLPHYSRQNPGKTVILLVLPLMADLITNSTSLRKILCL